MRVLKWLLIVVLCIDSTVESIEKCGVLDSVTFAEKGVIIKIPLKDNVEINISTSESRPNLLEKVDLNSMGFAGSYDGFFCGGRAEEGDTRACKKYLMHASHQMDLFPRSLICFKKMSSEGKSTFVVVLNSWLDKDSPFHHIQKQNSFKFAMRFLEALTLWVRDSVADLIPIAKLSDHPDKTNNFKSITDNADKMSGSRCPAESANIKELFTRQEWYRDLIINRTAFGGVYARYRFIDVTKPSNENEDSRKETVRQLYRFIEKFVYFDGSCTDIVKNSFHLWDGEALLKIFKESYRFPEDWISIYDRSSTLQFNLQQIEKEHMLSSTLAELSEKLTSLTYTRSYEVSKAYSELLVATKSTDNLAGDQADLKGNDESRKKAYDVYSEVQSRQQKEISELQAQIELVSRVRQRLVTSPGEMTAEGRHAYFLNVIAFAYCTNFINFDPNHLQFLADYFHMAFQKEELFEREKDLAEFDQYFNHSPSLPSDNTTTKSNFEDQPLFWLAIEQIKVPDHLSFEEAIARSDTFEKKQRQKISVPSSEQKIIERKDRKLILNQPNRRAFRGNQNWNVFSAGHPKAYSQSYFGLFEKKIL